MPKTISKHQAALKSPATATSSDVLGSVLRQLREAAGFTQAEFAQRIGVRQSYVSALENGTRWPSHRLLTRIADVFSVRVSSIMRLAESADPVFGIMTPIEEAKDVLRSIMADREPTERREDT